jgi:hypothetical protein
MAQQHRVLLSLRVGRPHRGRLRRAAARLRLRGFLLRAFRLRAFRLRGLPPRERFHSRMARALWFRTGVMMRLRASLSSLTRRTRSRMASASPGS